MRSCFLIGSFILAQNALAAGQTLEEAVRSAMRNSPRLKAARFGAEAGRAQADREKPEARPTLTVRADARLQGPRVRFPRGATGDATVLPDRFSQIELVLDQQLYAPGLSAAKVRFRAEWRTHDAEVQKEEAEVAQEVRRAYLDALEARAGAELAREGRDVARKHADLTKDMLAAGFSSERDVKAAEADLAEAEQKVVEAENGFQLAMGELRRTMGANEYGPLLLTEPVAPDRLPDEEVSLAKAIQNRPELQLLRLGIEAARAGEMLALSQKGPFISGRATAAAQTETAFSKSTYFAAGLEFRWPILDGGAARRDAREAGAQTKKLQALLEAAEQGIRLEVRKAYRDTESAVAREASASRQIESAEAALAISELRYEQRSALLLELSGARLGVSKAKFARLQARFDRLRALADLEFATGGSSDLNTREAKP